MSQISQPPALVKVVGRALAVSVVTSPADSVTIVLTSPGGGSWALFAAEIYNATGTIGSQQGSFFSAAAGAGINLGTVNLGSLTANTSRGLYLLSVKPMMPTTIYYRTTTGATGPSATVDIVVYGIQLT